MPSRRLLPSRLIVRPSFVHELAAETGLALGTVQKALSALKNEGLIYSVSGRGTS